MGQKIRQARKAKGYSMEKLGSFLGVTKATIFKYEKDEITNLKRSKIAEIAKVLEVDPVWLITDEEDDNNQDNDVIALREKLRTDPQYRILFKAAADVSTEDIMQAVRILKALKGE